MDLQRGEEAWCPPISWKPVCRNGATTPNKGLSDDLAFRALCALYAKRASSAVGP